MKLMKLKGEIKMYKLKRIKEHGEAMNKRAKKISEIEKEPAFSEKASFILKTNIWLTILVIVNFTLDIIPLYTMLELATSDNVFLLAFLTIAIPAILTAGSFTAGVQKTKTQQYLYLLIACLPQLFIIITRFMMKNQLFPISGNAGIQDVMSEKQVSSSGFDAASSLVLLLTCCAIVASILLAGSSKEEKESGRFEKMRAQKVLSVIDENITEVESLLIHEKEVILDYEGVIPEAIKFENNRYQEIHRQLKSCLENDCKTVRLKLAEHLGDPASMKYLTEQIPAVKDKIPDYQTDLLTEEEFEFKNYEKVGRPYYEKN